MQMISGSDTERILLNSASIYQNYIK